VRLSSQLPPLKTWFGLSLLGGFLGALNPAWYLLKSSHKEHVVSNYGLNYTNFASNSVEFYLSLLFIPALLSTACLFPFFHNVLQDQLLKRNIGVFKHSLNGFLFGCAASFPTAFFFMIQAIIFSFLNDYADPKSPQDVIGGFVAMMAAPFLLAPVGIAISFPAMLVSGWLFSTLTGSAIKKEQKAKMK